MMARRILAAGLECTGLEPTDLAGLRKNDERKALIAHLLMERTSVAQQWIVEELEMGSAPYVSRLAKKMGDRIATGDRTMRKLKKTIIARIITDPLFFCCHSPAVQLCRGCHRQEFRPECQGDLEQRRG